MEFETSMNINITIYRVCTYTSGKRISLSPCVYIARNAQALITTKLRFFLNIKIECLLIYFA